MTYQTIAYLPAQYDDPPLCGPAYLLRKRRVYRVSSNNNWQIYIRPCNAKDQFKRERYANVVLTPYRPHDTCSSLAPHARNFWFLSGSDLTGFPVAAKIAFITAGAATMIVGSPTPPQNPPEGTVTVSTLVGKSAMRMIS